MLDTEGVPAGGLLVTVEDVAGCDVVPELADGVELEDGEVLLELIATALMTTTTRPHAAHNHHFL
jgi:hypothetical protein